MSQAVEQGDIDHFRSTRSSETDTTFVISQNAVTQCAINDVSLSRSVSTGISHVVSHQLDDWAVCDQKSSGRCWLFAILNLLKARAANKLTPAETPEFSQVHTFFFDKLERSNYWLGCVSKCVEEGKLPGSREFDFLMGAPFEDGGQWNMAVNVIEKYGVVPKDVMPETKASGCTRIMNRVLEERIRKAARDIVAAKGDSEAIENVRKEALGDVWRILCITLGTPPEEFRWQWRDKEKKTHDGGLHTPKSFAAEFDAGNLASFVCLVHDPRNEYGKSYTVKFLGNVVGAKKTQYLNVPSEVLLDLTRESIVVNKEPVWFGCDVNKQFRNDVGVWHPKLLRYDDVFGASISGMNKTERLQFGQSLMTHAMVFTGVDIDSKDENIVNRLRVENSWGTEKTGRKGFQTMSTEWFHEYVYEIAVPREMIERLYPDLAKGIDLEPIELPAWDPFGALARNEF